MKSQRVLAGQDLEQDLTKVYHENPSVAMNHPTHRSDNSSAQASANGDRSAKATAWLHKEKKTSTNDPKVVEFRVPVNAKQQGVADESRKISMLLSCNVTVGMSKKRVVKQKSSRVSVVGCGEMEMSQMSRTIHKAKKALLERERNRHAEG